MRIGELLKIETIRRLEEGLGRIHICSGMLNDQQVWRRPNGNVTSIGNLILHLNGNVRQWIMTTLGGRKDERDRDSEFRERGPIDRVALLGALDRTVQEAKLVIDPLKADELERSWNVQGFQESGVGILVHVAEHFSYHTGQITLHTKLILDVDTSYYGGQDLNRKG